MQCFWYKMHNLHNLIFHYYIITFRMYAFFGSNVEKYEKKLQATWNVKENCTM